MSPSYFHQNKDKKLSVLCKLTCKAANYVKKRQVSQATVVVLVKYCPKRDEAFLSTKSMKYRSNYWPFKLCFCHLWPKKRPYKIIHETLEKKKKDNIVFGLNHAFPAIVGHFHQAKAKVFFFVVKNIPKDIHMYFQKQHGIRMHQSE